MRMIKTYNQLADWSIKNLTQREKELIYVFLNFQKACSIQENIELGRTPSSRDILILNTVVSYMANQKMYQ